jgi:hypothetical protein
MLQAMVDKRIGRRDQANAWIWRIAEYTREVHEEYAVQRWPETKRLLGLLVNSSGAAHARNARRLVHAARKQDRRLAAALLAAALAHTPEAEEVLRGARTRMARKPPALARELLRNFPKRRARNKRRRRGGRNGEGVSGEAALEQQSLNGSAPHRGSEATNGHSNGSASTNGEAKAAVAAVRRGGAEPADALAEQNVRLDAELRLAERGDDVADVTPLAEDASVAEPAPSTPRNGRRRSNGTRRRKMAAEEGAAGAGAGGEGADAGGSAGESSPA